jgi:hypothetical protein
MGRGAVGGLAWLGGFRAMIDGLVLGFLTLSFVSVVVLHV